MLNGLRSAAPSRLERVRSSVVSPGNFGDAAAGGSIASTTFAGGRALSSEGAPAGNGAGESVATAEEGWSLTSGTDGTGVRGVGSILRVVTGACKAGSSVTSGSAGLGTGVGEGTHGKTGFQSGSTTASARAYSSSGRGAEADVGARASDCVGVTGADTTGAGAGGGGSTLSG